MLTDAEIVTFWQACDRLGEPYDALFKLLLLTGCRLREASGMTRAELVDGVWTIAGARTKNHRPLTLPLPTMVADMIADVPVIDGEAGFVFTTDGVRPVSGFSQMKAALDAGMADIAGQSVPEFRLHDLRRTFVSRSGRARRAVAGDRTLHQPHLRQLRRHRRRLSEARIHRRKDRGAEALGEAYRGPGR